MKLQRWITYPLLSIAEFVVDLAIKAVIYNNSGNKLPSGYNTHKLFSKVADYYTDYLKSSPKWGIRAIFEARRNLLSELDRLSTSAYTVKAPTPAPVVTAVVEQVTKKVRKTSADRTEEANNSQTTPVNKDAATKALEESFVKSYPSLKSFKGLFFKLDSKADTLRFIQLVLIKIIRYTFWPLLLTTIYVYILKIISLLALFMGTGYGYLRYNGLDVQSSDITRIATIIRDYTINFWTKFINKAFGVELVNKEDLFKEAYQQALKDNYLEVREEAMARAEDIARNIIDDMRESYSRQLQDVYDWAARVDSTESLEYFKKVLGDSVNILKAQHKYVNNSPRDKIYLNDSYITLDPYINKINSIILDIGSYILSAVAVGTVIGVYLYWRSNNSGSGGGAAGSISNNLHLPRFPGNNLAQTTLHHPGTTGLAANRAARAVVNNNVQVVGANEAGDTMAIVKPVLKGIKFAFVIVGNGIMSLAIWFSGGNAADAINTGPNLEGATEQEAGPSGNGSHNTDPQGSGLQERNKDPNYKGKGREKATDNHTEPLPNPVALPADFSRGIEIPGSNVTVINQSNVLNESTNSSKTIKQIEADLIEQTIGFTDFL